MNAIRQTQQLNKRELENAIPPSASWHADYRDTAYVYIGGLPLDLTEGDVVTIFSQYGNPTHLNMIRDKETGKSKGFAFLKYEDQRSCDLAVDNLGGAEVLGRLLRVDHTRYKKRDDEDEDTHRIDRLEVIQEDVRNENGKRASDTEESGSEERKKRSRKSMKEGRDRGDRLAVKANGEDQDEEDPTRNYVDRERREDGVRRSERGESREHRHRHQHHHRDRGDDRVREGKERRDRRQKDDHDGSRRRYNKDKDQDRGEYRDRKRESKKERDGDEKSHQRRDDRKRRSLSQDSMDVDRPRKHEVYKNNEKYTQKRSSNRSRSPR